MYLFVIAFGQFSIDIIFYRQISGLHADFAGPFANQRVEIKTFDYRASTKTP